MTQSHTSSCGSYHLHIASRKRSILGRLYHDVVDAEVDNETLDLINKVGLAWPLSEAGAKSS